MSEPARVAFPAFAAFNDVRALEIHLTHRCNLRCSYCYAGREHADRPPDLTPELADQAVDFLFASCGDTDSLKLSLWGGEPLVRPDLIERIAVRGRAAADAADKKLSISFPTNVTLLDEKTRALLEKHRIGVSLSLDGRPDAYTERKTVSGDSGWRLIGPRVDEIVADWPRPLPGVRMTITPERADQFAGDVAYLLERGFRSIAFLPSAGTNWDEERTAQLDGQLDQIADQFVSWFRKERDNPPVFTHILGRLTALWMEKELKKLPKRSGTCGAGHTMLAMDTLGNLYPCHRFVARTKPPEELRLGSIQEGLTNQPLYDQLRSYDPTKPGNRCATCDSQLHCGRVCIWHNYDETGDLAEIPDAACHVQERSMRIANRIHEALVDNKTYRTYIERCIEAGPDAHVIPALAVLENKMDSILDRASALLGSGPDTGDTGP